MYALRDLTGHCYVHFAFVFTLTEERQKTTTNPKTTEQIKTLTEETQQITEQTDMSITEASQKDIEEPQKTNEQTETSKDKITKNTARAMSTGETHKTLEDIYTQSKPYQKKDQPV